MDNTENTQIDAQADAAEATETTETSTSEVSAQTTDMDTTSEHNGQEHPDAAELGLPLPESIDPPVLVIAPSVGRKVHFYPGNVQFHSKPHCINPAVPMDATVVFVWSDRMVNLQVVDHIGQVHALTSITLRQPDDVIAEGAAYAEWMPFQVGQARASV